MIKKLNLSAFLTIIFLTPLFAQTDDQFRVFCKEDAARQLALKQLEGRDREEFEEKLALRCPRIDLPTIPLHAADPSPEASHTDWGYDARYSPNGRRIVSASRDGTVRVWDAETGKPIRRIAAAIEKPLVGASRPGIVRRVTFVGDETRIAASSDENPVRLFDVASGEMIAEFPFVHPRPDDTTAPRVAATTNSLLLIAGYRDDVEAIDAGTRALRYRLTGHDAEATAIAVSEAADLVATGGSDGIAGQRVESNTRVYLWRLSTGEKIADMLLGNSRPEALAFSRDGSQLAVISHDTVQIYSVTDKRVTQTIKVHPFYGFFDAAFTADGKGLMTCRSHPQLWDLATGKLVRHFGPFNDLCHSVDVSPDGRFAVTTSMGSDIRVWEIATGAFYRRLGVDVHPPR